MIETRITCDSDFHYSKKSETLVSAVEQKWIEVDLHPGSITWCVVLTMDGFDLHAKHACNAACARNLIENFIADSIADPETPKELPQAAPETEKSDIPF